MAQYFVSQDAVALVAATAKTVFELATPATARAKIKTFWVEFDGTSASATPVKIEIARASAAVTTATAVTPSKMDAADGASGSTTKHSTSTEGAGTLSDVLYHRISPTAGVVYQFPLGDEFIVAVSSFARVRITAGANVNCTFGVIWEE